VLCPVLLDLRLPHHTVGPQVEVCHGGGHGAAVGATTSCRAGHQGTRVEGNKSWEEGVCPVCELGKGEACQELYSYM
jgi:hypothetical protein